MKYGLANGLANGIDCLGVHGVSRCVLHIKCICCFSVFGGDFRSSHGEAVFSEDASDISKKPDSVGSAQF